MNCLTEIIDSVRANGSHEHDWLPLINAYFRGADCFQKIEQWATDNGMKVMFFDNDQVCRFYIDPEAADRATQDPIVR